LHQHEEEMKEQINRKFGMDAIAIEQLQVIPSEG
jgi:hypothetical protein